MVRPQLRARTLRRIQRRTPGGTTVQHYGKRKPSRAKCANCNGYLSGVPHTRASKLHSMSKSQRRPERPYGGQYCSKCSREMIKARVRPMH